MIIGLTGLNGSGKGVVAEYLASVKGFKYHSLSDAVREEVLKKDPVITREKLIVTANAIREKYGPAELARRIIKKLDISLNTVVDSFRNPEEVNAFYTLAEFELWAISASREIRFERIKLRQREQDPRTLKEFVLLEQRELTSKNPASQNLSACLQLARRTLENNADLKKLYLAIDVILKEKGL